MDRAKTLVRESASSLCVEHYYGAVVTGILGGFSVGLVGTDIFHSVLLTAILSVIHLRMGTIDLRLVALLLFGAIFGVFLGFRLTTIDLTAWLRRAVPLLLIPLGFSML